MNGKGSTPRPSRVPKAERDANWERTFGQRTTEHAEADLRDFLYHRSTPPPTENPE